MSPTHPTVSPAIKGAMAVLVSIAGLLDLGWSTTGLLTFLVVALAVPATYGATVWYAPDNTHRLAAERPTT